MSGVSVCSFSVLKLPINDKQEHDLFYATEKVTTPGKYARSCPK